MVVVLLIASPMAVLDLVQMLIDDAKAHGRNTDNVLGSGEILAWYFGIWIVVSLFLLMGSHREVTHNIDFKDSWGSPVGRGTIHTGNFQKLYNPQPALRFWTLFYLGLPVLIWIMLKLGLIHILRFCEEGR